VRNLVEAINDSLHNEMDRDPNVLVMGEDVGRAGGVFRVTAGLQDRFGADRCIDTPLAEAGLLGTAVGLCMTGWRPVVEMQYGGGVRAPELHEDSPEAYYVHTPGIKVVMPSNAADAKGLLAAAIRDPDPVVFFEPKVLYRSEREEVPDGEHVVPLGEARVVREGSDVTIVAYGAMVRVAGAAADLLAAGGISAHVLDLRSLRPLDEAALLTAVRRTGRAVIVQEAPRTAGFGAELAAIVAEHAMLELYAPVQRVTGYDVAFPYWRLEDVYIPSAARIVAAVRRAMEY
jgi:pyruvate/2-oxoglutarate/acetoin dehydrogenase E1 component